MVWFLNSTSRREDVPGSRFEKEMDWGSADHSEGELPGRVELRLWGCYSRKPDRPERRVHGSREGDKRKISPSVSPLPCKNCDVIWASCNQQILNNANTCFAFIKLAVQWGYIVIPLRVYERLEVDMVGSFLHANREFLFLIWDAYTMWCN